MIIIFIDLSANLLRIKTIAASKVIKTQNEIGPGLVHVQHRTTPDLHSLHLHGGELGPDMTFADTHLVTISHSVMDQLTDLYHPQHTGITVMPSKPKVSESLTFS